MASKFIFSSVEHVKALKARIAEGRDPGDLLRERAEETATRGPWSVTFSKSPAASEDGLRPTVWC